LTKQRIYDRVTQKFEGAEIARCSSALLDLVYQLRLSPGRTCSSLKVHEPTTGFKLGIKCNRLVVAQSPGDLARIRIVGLFVRMRLCLKIHHGLPRTRLSIIVILDSDLKEFRGSATMSMQVFCSVSQSWWIPQPSALQISEHPHG
jgi:hypothetical protein